MGHLDRGGGQHRTRLAQVDLVGVDVGGDLLPRRLPVLVGGRLAPGVGQLEQALAAVLAGHHQAFVGQQLQGRVDRAGARPPEATAALGDLTDDLVTVPRLLGQQGEDGGAHVAPPSSPPAVRATGAAPPELAARTARAPARGELSETTAGERAEGGPSVRRGEMSVSHVGLLPYCSDMFTIYRKQSEGKSRARSPGLATRMSCGNRGAPVPFGGG
ncbi:hypothetical protein AMETH_1647 [Amycolatopsis methanolica 239]|uniref:Uncharacterized protein n=1 Tax=Amycolatopsis methanolica 239 TaxID=1068978 RepID=A0A076MLY7_AMYME|nr:hypothetical protein AMETH_1647 [Amycolatopsis methanolica 239]